MSRRSRSAQIREEAFIQHYCAGLTGAEAARKAGYAAKSSNVTASRLLTKANVQARIDSINLATAQAHGITRERVSREIARLSFSDVRAYYDADNNLKPLAELSADQAAAICAVESEEIFSGSGEDRTVSGVSRKFKLWSKISALEQAAAILGMRKSVDPAAGTSLSVTIIPSTHAKARSSGSDGKGE